MLPDVRDDEQVARRRAHASALPFALHAHARTRVHARRNAHLHRLDLRHDALTMTDRTRRPAFTHAATIGTFLRETESPARALHLPSAFARRASNGRAAR